MGMNLDELERLHRKAVGGDWRNLPSNMLNEIWEAFPALLALARDGERYRERFSTSETGGLLVAENAAIDAARKGEK